jgi:hypothetical protein
MKITKKMEGQFCIYRGFDGKTYKARIVRHDPLFVQIEYLVRSLGELKPMSVNVAVPDLGRLTPIFSPELTGEDWEEIYYALDYKLTSPAVSGDRRWKAHLKAILETIGPDGSNMADVYTSEEESADVCDVTEQDETLCTCANRSWYGEEHDSACELQGKRYEGEEGKR